MYLDGISDKTLACNNTNRDEIEKAIDDGVDEFDYSYLNP